MTDSLTAFIDLLSGACTRSDTEGCHLCGLESFTASETDNTMCNLQNMLGV